MVHITSGNDLLGPKYREIQFIQQFFVVALINSECCICVYSMMRPLITLIDTLAHA